MRNLFAIFCVFGFFAMSGSLHAEDPVETKFTVMTRNVYVGANLQSIIDADTPDELLAGMANVLEDVQATDFHERAIALADEIEANKPHLIGLQEVAIWRTQTPADGPLTAATDVEYDFLAILMGELASRGLNYEVLEVFNGFNFEAPGLFDDGLKDVRFTDRDAVLGRVTSRFEFSNIKKKKFASNYTIGTGIFGDVKYKRGYESVDVTDTLNNAKFRFINTHLEVFSGAVRLAQAQQLVDSSADTSLPVVMVGDFNAQPGFSDAYDEIVSSGFADAWEEEHPNSAGLTCCQDADLGNGQSELSSRIDLVFISDGVSTRSAKRVGQDEADRTASGLWPSDHAGVVVKLKLD
jgi:endonuclease/exonuclease/phosphatase family metal-dependent hydrolase